MVGAGPRQTISACIITRDEEERLPAALRSVAFCDEIIVVDSGSTDGTVEIAGAAGAKVVKNTWPGFGAQRNVAIDNATGDWVLEIDSDERVSWELRTEIERFLAEPPPGVGCCVLPLRHRFLGGWLGASAKYPLYRVRLFRRTAYRHDEARRVHEGLWPRGRAWAMRGDLHHELASSWSEALHDLWSYSKLESAHVERPRGARALFALVVRPTVKFGYRVVIDGGWRDGWRGFVKIALDCVSDIIVYTRALTGRVPPRIEAPEQEPAPRRGGSVRIAYVARGERARAKALPWLRAAHAAGADVALVTEAGARIDDASWLHVQELDGGGPLDFVRAFDALAQQRTVDQLVLGRRTARWLPRLLALPARGVVAPATPAADPVATVRALEAATR